MKLSDGLETHGQILWLKTTMRLQNYNHVMSTVRFGACMSHWNFNTMCRLVSIRGRLLFMLIRLKVKKLRPF